MRGAVSKTGYKKNSPDVYNDYNIIPSGNLTMEDVEFPVMGIDNLGNKKLMMPGVSSYQFPGSSVVEIPMGYHRMPNGSLMSNDKMQNSNNMKYKRFGGDFSGISPEQARTLLTEGKVYGEPLTTAQRTRFAEIAGTDEAGNYAEDVEETDYEDVTGEEAEYMRRGGTFYQTGGDFKTKPLFAPTFGPNMGTAEQQLDQYTKKYGVPDVKYGSVNRDVLSGAITGPRAFGLQDPLWNSTEAYTTKQLEFQQQLPGETTEQFIARMSQNKRMGGSFYQGGGDFVVPPSAEKVGTVPGGFNLLGTKGAKTYYDKSASQAIPGTTPGSTPNPGWEDSIINMLKAGTSPEALVAAGHISPTQIERFRPYYKAVYTEQPQTTTSLKPSIPLDVSGTIDRKEITIPGSQKFKTYDYPDQNAGYSKATRKTFDPSTDQEIDALKSFDASGNYSPFFLNTGPKSAGTTKQMMDENGNIIPTENPLTPALSGGFKMGGSHMLKKFMKNYMKQMGGNTSPQGMTMDDYLGEQQNAFKNYLTSNTMKSILSDEVQNIYMQLGGQNIMMDENQMDDMPIVTPPQTQFNHYPTFETTGNSAFYTGQNPVNAGKQSWLQNQWQKNRPYFADELIAGTNMLASAFEGRDRKAQEKKLQQQMQAENLFGAKTGNRGDYETNTGYFRPDKMNPTMYSGYKMGGNHKCGDVVYMEDGALENFLQMGGQVEFID